MNSVSKGSVVVPINKTKVEKLLSELSNHVAQLQKNTIKTNFDINQLQYEVQEFHKRFSERTGFIYIASPYTHSDPSVRQHRYQQAMWYTMQLLQNREWCYSPIVHCHEMARLHDLPFDAQHWMNYNFAMLSCARELRVLCLPEWEQSVGVSAEVAFWRHSKGTPVKFIRH